MLWLPFLHFHQCHDLMILQYFTKTPNPAVQHHRRYSSPNDMVYSSKQTIVVHKKQEECYGE